MAVPWICRVPRAKEYGYSIFCLHARDARPVVQANIPVKTSQEVDVLAMGGVPGTQARSGSDLYLRRGTIARKAVVLALPMLRSRHIFRNERRPRRRNAVN